MMGSIISKVLGAPNALLRGLAERLVISKLRAIIEGPPGPLRSALLWVQGYKTALGLALGALAFVASYFGPPEGYVMALGWVSAVLVGVGLADKGLQQPNRPEALATNGWYLLLARNAGTIASVLTAGFAYTASANCKTVVVLSLSISCGQMSNALLVMALLLVYLGVLDQGFVSPKPKVGGRPPVAGA